MCYAPCFFEQIYYQVLEGSCICILSLTINTAEKYVFSGKLIEKNQISHYLKLYYLKRTHIRAGIVIDRTTQLIEDADWERITLELYSYADWSIRKLIWRGSPAGSDQGSIALANGKDAKDYCNEAIRSILDSKSKRHWHPERDPDLQAYLKSTMKSMIWNDSQLLENKTTRRQFPGLVNSDGKEVDIIANAVGDDAPPDTELVRQDLQSQQKLLLEAFRKSIASDSELTDLLDAYEAGFTKPRDVAEVTDLSAERIYELNRKLRTKMNNFIKDIGVKRKDIMRGPL